MNLLSRVSFSPLGDGRGSLVALEDDTRFLYKTTDYYARDCEAAIRWDDPELAIQWPQAGPFIINQKDREALLLAEKMELSK